MTKTHEKRVIIHAIQNFLEAFGAFDHPNRAEKSKYFGTVIKYHLLFTVFSHRNPISHCDK
jgi:hypothetical protein